MVNVGFIIRISKEWMGGLNYFKNLFLAVSRIEKREIMPIVFIGRSEIFKETEQALSEVSKIIKSTLFDKNSFITNLCDSWLKTFKNDGLRGLLLFLLLKKYSVKIISHSGYPDGIHVIKKFFPGKFKLINWIPDFQHLHIPEMFNENDIAGRNTINKFLIKESDIMILSSYDALNDYKNFAPEYEKKARVLQFVSSPDKSIFYLAQNDFDRIREKYSLPAVFFYIPNQFWKHKNHLFVFRVINELKSEGLQIILVCTGYLDDHRNLNHIKDLREYIAENHLEKNIIILGPVDYNEVMILMVFSKAIINPSLFEGWSTTVEESKSLGKKILLSDIPVHREQNPEKGIYFDPLEPSQLKNILKNELKLNEPPLDIEQMNLIKLKLDKKFEEFGVKYQNIVLDLLKA
jgi:glycosyltransferase involved in cell wall biosynthesis